MGSEHESREEADASVRLRAFGLADIHPLWGGRSLWATDDLSADVCVVDASQHRERLRLSLTPEDWSEIERLVADSRLLTATIPGRNGVPDEGRPSITLVLASGETVVRAKWANDSVPAFDRVYQQLLAVSERTGG